MWRFLKDVDIDLSYDPASPLLSIYSKNMNTIEQRDTCSTMLIEALFTIAKISLCIKNQPKCIKDPKPRHRTTKENKKMADRQIKRLSVQQH